MIGDSQCDFSCMSASCGWDNGDCASKCSCPKTSADGICDEACNTWECGFDKGDCAVCKAGCTAALLANDACDDACNDPLCDYDNGKCSETSAEVYVTSSGTGNNLGSFEHPYKVVSDALTFKAVKQLTVWLLSGTHQLTKVTNASSVTNVNNPLTGTSVPRKILVKSLRCSASSHSQCATDRSTLKLVNKDFTLTVTAAFEFNDLILSGKIELKAGCTAETCYYCPTALKASGSNWLNDKGEIVDSTKYAAQSLCDYYRTKNPFTLKSTGTLTMKSVLVTDFRQQYRSIIEYEGGAIYLKDTDFISIQTSTSSSKNAAIALRSCTKTGPINCGTFEYDGGVIEFLNNGYLLSSTARYNGLLHLEGVYSIKLINIKARNNFTNSGQLFFGNDPWYAKSIAEIYNVRVLYIEGFEATNNYLASVIAVVCDEVFPIVDDGNGYSKEHLLAKMTMTSSLFKDTSAMKSRLVTIWLVSEAYDIMFRNITFDSCIGYYQVLYIEMPSSTYKLVAYDSTKNTPGGVTVKINPAWVKFDGLKLYKVVTDQEFYIYLVNYPNAEIKGGNFEGWGLSEPSSLSLPLQTSWPANPSLYSKVVPISFNYAYCLVIGTDKGVQFIIGNTIIRNYACTNVNLLNVRALVYQSDGVTLQESQCLRCSSCSVVCDLTVIRGVFMKVKNFMAKNLVAVEEAMIQYKSSTAWPNYISYTEIEFTDMTFINNESTDRTMISVITTAGSFNNIKMISNKHHASEPMMYIIPLSQTLNTISISDCVFKDNVSDIASIFSIEKTFNPFIVAYTRLTFDGNEANEEAAFSIEGLVTTGTMTDCVFIRNKGEKVMALSILADEFKILRSNFTDNIVKVGSLVATIEGKTSDLNSNESGTIHIQDCLFARNLDQAGFSGSKALSIPLSAKIQVLSITQTTFEFNTVHSMAVNYAKVTASKVTFRSNTRTAVYLDKSSMAAFSLSTFTNNTVSKLGAAGYVTGSSTLVLNDCKIEGNTAKTKAAGIFVEKNSKLQAFNTQFIANKAQGASTLVFSFTLGATSLLKGCTFSENLSNVSGPMELISAVVELEGCSVLNNRYTEAGGISSGIVLEKSDVKVRDSTFSDQGGKRGSFFFLKAGSTLSLESSSVTRALAKDFGGVVYAESSSINVKSSSFTQNKASQGGAFYLLNCQTTITGSSFSGELTPLTLNDSGADVYAKGSSLTILQSSFESSGSESLLVEDLSSFKVTESSFKLGLKNSRIFVKRSQVEMEGNTFENNSNSTQGAAVKLEGVGSSNIQRNSFSGNSACYGGSVYLLDSNSTLTSNSFNNNSAHCESEGEGGAVLVDCTQNCETVMEHNSFTNNSAFKDGGAIKWKAKRPQLIDNFFENNSAQYGADFAAYPSKPLHKAASLNRDSGFNLSNSIISGQPVKTPFIITIVDTEGQTVSTDSFTICELESDKGVEIAGEFKKTSVKGIIEFGSFTLSGPVGSNINLNVVCTNSRITSSIEEFDQELFLRNCVKGESLKGNECEVCKPGTYSFNPAEPCKECPEGAECYGNFTLAPQKGYWRKSDDSESFYECSREDSCLSPEESGFSLTGQCAEHYTGAKCGGCVEGYALNSNFECLECTQDAKSQFVRVLLFVVSGVFILVNVILALGSATKTKSLLSVYFKVLMNFFQVTIIIVSLKYDWPSLFTNFLSFQITMGESSGVSFNFYCLTDTLSSKESFYMNTIFIATLPFGLISVAAAIWLCVRLFKRVEHFKAKFLCSVTVLVFNVLPQVTKTMFSLFSCEDIEGDYWLSTDFSVECWDSQHTLYSVALALPSLLIWTVFLPTVCILYLRKRKQNLEDLSTKYVMGFLYHGYRAELYFWEFLVFYRKIFVIIIAVFMSKFQLCQAIFISTVLFATLSLQMQAQPFTTPNLNKVEELSILTSVLTISLGFSFTSTSMGSVYEYFGLISLLSVLTCFFSLVLTEIARTLIATLVMKYPKLKDLRFFKALSS